MICGGRGGRPLIVSPVSRTKIVCGRFRLPRRHSVRRFAETWKSVHRRLRYVRSSFAKEMLTPMSSGVVF